MGNSESIPQEVRDRFATCELECMEKNFDSLAKEGSFRGKTFDCSTFKRHYLKQAPEIAEMIFVAFDCDGNRKIDFHEFVQGLSHCTRGSLSEKHRFAFAMFDSDKSKKISRKEFCKGIGSSYFGPKGETASDRKKRIERTVNDVFAQYDTDKDGFLSTTEFMEWAKDSKEIDELLKLFKIIDNKLTDSSDAGVAQPMHVTHDTHVGLTKSGAMTIDTIPPSWVLLFKQAGASEKELQNPELVVELMGIVAEKLTQKANLSNPDLSNLQIDSSPTPPRTPQNDSTPPPTVVEPAPPTPVVEPAPPTPQKDSAPPTPVAEPAPPTPQKDSAPPTPVTEPAPPTPQKDSAPPTPVVEPTPVTPEVGVSPPATPQKEVGKSSDSVNAPPAPAPPSPGPPSAPASAGGNADLLSDIKGGVKLHHTETKKSTKSADPKDSLLAEIKKKPQLRHVDPEEIEKMSTDDRNDLTSVLARAIQSHRQKMNIDPDGNEVENDNDADWD